MLNIIPFKIRHTRINIANSISNILKEFNLTNKILALTIDNESAMIVCGWQLKKDFKQVLDNLSFRHYCCLAYILNLVVKQGMKIIDKDIWIIWTIMIKIKNSVLLCDDLCELCIIKKFEYLRPEIDIETRWNSTYNMLHKFQRIETALKMLAIKHKSLYDLMPDTTTYTKIKVRTYILRISNFFRL